MPPRAVWSSFQGSSPRLRPSWAGPSHYRESTGCWRVVAGANLRPIPVTPRATRLHVRRGKKLPSDLGQVVASFAKTQAPMLMFQDEARSRSSTLEPSKTRQANNVRNPQAIATHLIAIYAIYTRAIGIFDRLKPETSAKTTSLACLSCRPSRPCHPFASSSSSSSSSSSCRRPSSFSSCPASVQTP